MGISRYLREGKRSLLLDPVLTPRLTVRALESPILGLNPLGKLYNSFLSQFTPS